MDLAPSRANSRKWRVLQRAWTLMERNRLCFAGDSAHECLARSTVAVLVRRGDRTREVGLCAQHAAEVPPATELRGGWQVVSSRGLKRNEILHEVISRRRGGSETARITEGRVRRSR